jgi:hypothetical protein
MEPTPSSAALAIDHYPAIEKMLGEIKSHFGFKYESKEVNCDSVEDKLKPYNFQ